MLKKTTFSYLAPTFRTACVRCRHLLVTGGHCALMAAPAVFGVHHGTKKTREIGFNLGGSRTTGTEIPPCDDFELNFI